MRGYIYILHSPERPGIVKIGKTTKSPKIRCGEHNRNWYLSINTWDIAFWRWVENCCAAEIEIFQLISKYNLGAKSHREAFRIDISLAKKAAIMICDRYPASDDKPLDPIFKKRRTLDNAAYNHIKKQKPLAETIIKNKQIMAETDFYKWLYEIRNFLE